MSKAARKGNLFKETVEATPDIATGYMVGLRALGAYSALIKLGDYGQCEGSVDIDACTSKKYPTVNRWDYVISYRGKTYYIEVHSAETGEVSKVLRILKWLKKWLNNHAVLINKFNAKIPYYWIQSGRYNIQKNSPQFRQAIQAGIKPIPQLLLD